MNKSTKVVSALLLATCITAAPGRSAHAQEPEQRTATSGLRDMLLWTGGGAQLSKHDGLEGFSSEVYLGIEVSSRSARRMYIEAGVGQLILDQPPSISFVAIGARNIWSWDRVSLHLAGHLRHGDDTMGDAGVSIGSSSADVSVAASYDIFHIGGTRFALAADVRAALYEAWEGEDRTVAVGGGVGLLNFMIW